MIDEEERSRLDALAKMLLVGLPISAVVSYHKGLDKLVLDVWSQVGPHSTTVPQKRTFSVKAAECPDRDMFVRERVGGFIDATGARTPRR